MTPIDLAAARRERWDVIVAGTGFAACFFGLALRGRGFKVLFVERGAFVDRDTQLATRLEERPVAIRQHNRSPYRKDWIVRHQFGGGSNCWWGNTPRLHPTDFELRSRYGVGADWPIGYADLEPYMVQVEDAMEVAGESAEHILPRSSPYPLPPHAPTRAERVLAAHDPSWVPMPCARSTGGRRSSCCASGSCGLCPMDAKFTILNSIDRFEDPGFRYLTLTECRSVVTEGGAASAVLVRTPAGVEAEINGDFIALAANAISNAAIMLRSRLGSDLVGRGLHEQASQFVWIDIPFDNYYGGTSITGAGYGFYDGDFRHAAGSVFIESWNAPPSLRLEPGKWLQRLKLKLIAEDLPQPDNRVVLEEDEPAILWKGHSDYAYAGLARAREKLGGLLPFAHKAPSFGEYEPTEAHVQGGTPMGTHGASAVVDRDCKVFGVPGLACLGAGVFPTCSAVNPTLTLCAIALRAGERL